MNVSNPARLSSDFQRLFPSGVVAAELAAPGDTALLLPEEAACLGRAVTERQQEFAAGRLCARRALAELGITGFALIAGPERQPVWPASMVGSITHTIGLCAAVVAPRSHFLGLGVDSEVVGRVRAELRRRICVQTELDWVDSLPVAQQDGAAALVFAAKEAFYKCQSPLSAEWLGFHDVRIEAAEFAAALTAGTLATFTALPTRTLALEKFTPLPLQGRYQFHRGFVSAGIAIAAV